MVTEVGRGNLAFEFFDYHTTLGREADAHLAAFDAHVDRARDDLRGLVPAALATGAPGAVLVWAGVRPRLREYA
jgi:hypothetical protein